MSAVKSVCPISRAEFRHSAEAITAQIAGSSLVLQPKEFSTASLGWFANGKVTVRINGKVVTCQLGLNLTIVGSKELPQ